MDDSLLLETFLAEDVGEGDITSESVVDPQPARATIVARAYGILAGTDEGIRVFTLMGCEASKNFEDGDRISRGDIVLEATGDAGALLTAERLVLNIMTRMSGVATTTRNLVDLAHAVNPDVIVAATRKTIPGFRLFEKRAVVTGGGNPHRWGLYDAVLIKENHLVFTRSPVEAVQRALEAGHSPVEIEATSHDMALECAKAGADTIMLDNFTPDDVKSTYEALKAEFPDVTVEVSGGIDGGNIQNYAAYADIISVGALTHSAKALDLSMDIYRVE